MTQIACPHAGITECRLNGRAFRATSDVRPRFWQVMADGRWEAVTLRVFDEFINEQTVVFDIGAWMGPTTLYAAPAAAHVISFEPDPVAFRELSRNIALNRDQPWHDRIEAVNRAVGVTAGRMRIGSREGFGQSVSSALYHDAADSIEVDVIPFDALAADWRMEGHKAFVKIDIEGGEYELLLHPSRLLARPDTVLFLSMHPRILRQRERADSSYWPHAMVRRRLAFVRRHQDIFLTLPFRYYYTADGEPLSFSREFIRALVFGKFAREIVCTHKPWDGPDVQSSTDQLIERGARRSGDDLLRAA